MPKRQRSFGDVSTHSDTSRSESEIISDDDSDLEENSRLNFYVDTHSKRHRTYAKPHAGIFASMPRIGDASSLAPLHSWYLSVRDIPGVPAIAVCIMDVYTSYTLSVSVSGVHGAVQTLGLLRAGDDDADRQACDSAIQQAAADPSIADSLSRVLRAALVAAHETSLALSSAPGPLPHPAVSPTDSTSSSQQQFAPKRLRPSPARVMTEQLCMLTLLLSCFPSSPVPSGSLHNGDSAETFVAARSPPAVPRLWADFWDRFGGALSLGAASLASDASASPFAECGCGRGASRMACSCNGAARLQSSSSASSADSLLGNLRLDSPHFFAATNGSGSSSSSYPTPRQQLGEAIPGVMNDAFPVSNFRDMDVQLAIVSGSVRCPAPSWTAGPAASQMNPVHASNQVYSPVQSITSTSVAPSAGAAGAYTNLFPPPTASYVGELVATAAQAAAAASMSSSDSSSSSSTRRTAAIQSSLQTYSQRQPITVVPKLQFTTKPPAPPALLPERSVAAFVSQWNVRGDVPPGVPSFPAADFHQSRIGIVNGGSGIVPESDASMSATSTVSDINSSSFMEMSEGEAPAPLTATTGGAAQANAARAGGRLQPWRRGSPHTRMLTWLQC